MNRGSSVMFKIICRVIYVKNVRLIKNFLIDLSWKINNLIVQDLLSEIKLLKVMH